MTTSSISPPSGSSPLHDTQHDGPDAASDHSPIAPGEIAVGVIIGRASEYFDFFVYGIASVLVFPSVFFPMENRLEGTLYAFVIFSFAFIARPKAQSSILRPELWFAVPARTTKRCS